MSNQLNKSLRVLFAVEFILILTIIALALIGNQEIPTGYAVKENTSSEKTDLKVFTKAVCEERNEHVFCKDELFIECNCKEIIAKKENLNEFTECGIKINLSDIFANGSAEFRKGWTDPRK